MSNDGEPVNDDGRDRINSQNKSYQVSLPRKKKGGLEEDLCRYVSESVKNPGYDSYIFLMPFGQQHN